MSTLEKLPELAELKKRAVTFAKEYRPARKAVADASKALLVAQERVKDREAEIAIEVTEARDDKDPPKALFTNKESRDAETRKRLAKDVGYQSLQSEVDVRESAKLNAQLDLQGVEDEHKAYQQIVDLTIAEVDLLLGRK